MDELKKIMELFHYLTPEINEEKNYLILQKIKENIEKGRDFMVNNPFLFKIEKLCKYNLDNQEDVFTTEIKEMNLHLIYSELLYFEGTLNKETKSLMEDLASSLNLDIIDLRRD